MFVCVCVFNIVKKRPSWGERGVNVIDTFRFISGEIWPPVRSGSSCSGIAPGKPQGLLPEIPSGFSPLIQLILQEGILKAGKERGIGAWWRIKTGRFSVGNGGVIPDNLFLSFFLMLSVGKGEIYGTMDGLNDFILVLVSRYADVLWSLLYIYFWLKKDAINQGRTFLAIGVKTVQLDDLN